ncbi:HAD-superfamily hydrolase, subfamily IA, variant 1 family protein [Roseobacter sp. SK209-2-6]|uniref:HAD family hydrolase n=1 Tax=Roseobacter sp. SK209-2-6 TaxID=388739 RepID=UPI0000F3CDA5|nr:HAD family phosphatase [Roseobacter sp. SK209-2-6]EBA14801.1 HAD-superfamily hydrolase, subfamily IA, variant 1 family protein [Roseobacter sp. SK209-2-6]
MRAEAVVFDIGNVLVKWDPERFYDARLGKEARQRLFREVPLHEMNLGLDRGDPFRESVYSLAEAHPDWAEEIRHWHDSWLEFAHSDIPQSIRLLRQLRQNGVPVFALSNFGIGTFDLAREAFPVLEEFDHACISGHLGCIKPDPEIYQILEQQTGIAPGALIFADDRPENTAAAQARGWQTHLFTTPEGWAARLVEAGLLTAKEAQ